ncbi:hypothetical protein RvY_13750 [Ramazzottius varieornatus]|uniref:Uncharacterized protein n=1 Tax=Ramazzottius varieornatus TaxID=947166 RepID=A0A1D1VR43_RAMVA|nr:hypothetical protein RvY_13750 [Ramazzottius varieornatus]
MREKPAAVDTSGTVILTSRFGLVVQFSQPKSVYLDRTSKVLSAKVCLIPVAAPSSHYSAESDSPVLAETGQTEPLSGFHQRTDVGHLCFRFLFIPGSATSVCDLRDARPCFERNSKSPTDTRSSNLKTGPSLFCWKSGIPSNHIPA